VCAAAVVADTAILDVDGTLVDTNYHHALAWSRAFRRYDVVVPIWRLHRGIGMGGDQFVTHVAGARVEHDIGDELRDAWAEEFEPMLEEIVPFEGVERLLLAIKERGLRLVLASSGKQEHVEAFLDLFDGRDVADGWITSDDVERSKPHPDLLQVALDRVGGTAGVMVGDSPWDCVAATKLGLPTVALRSGGFSADELRVAGAVAVFESLTDLHDRLDETPLGAADA